MPAQLKVTVKARPASGGTVAPGATIRYTLHAKSRSGPLPAGARVVDDLSGLLGNATVATPERELANRGLRLNATTQKLTWTLPAATRQAGSGTAAKVSFRATVAADAPDGAKLTTAAAQPGESCGRDEPCATKLTVRGDPATQSPDPSPSLTHGATPSHSPTPSPSRSQNPPKSSTPKPDLTASMDPRPSSPGPSATSSDPSPTPDASPTASPATPTVTASRSTLSSTPPSAKKQVTPLAADPCDPVNDPVDAGGFEIDGNLCTDADTPGDIDWDMAGTQPVATDPYYPDDNSGFTSGQSENTGPNWTVAQTSGSVVPGQGRNDIGNVYASTRVAGEDVFAYFGFELRGGTGTMSLHAELNQKPNDDPSCPRGNRGIPSPCRTVGDLLLAFDKTGSGPITLTQAWTWNGSAWVVLGNAGEVGRANNADITNLQGQTLAEGRFGEVAVDLTTLFGPATCSGNYGTLNLRTSASTTLTSSLIDWVAPIHLGVPSTCPMVELQKHWVNGFAGDTAGLSVTDGAGALSGSATSTANGEPDFTDTENRATAEAEPGSTVDLSETLPAPGHRNTGTYTPELPETCEISGDGTVDFVSTDQTSGTITVPDSLGAGDTITCTFTNRRTQAMLRVEKAWVDSVAGDEAELSISGPNALTSDQATAVAPGGDGTSSEFAEAPIFSGETVDVREALPPGNTGAYTSEITCEPDTGFTAGTGGRAGSIDVPANPTDTTCTFTNTRSATGELTLQKDWVNGASGDSAGLSASGSLGSGSATATVPDHGATSIDKVVIAVTAGETVDLSEVLPASGHTNTGTYTSTLECNEPGLHGVAGDGRSGSFDVTAAHENVTCTFTNTRTQAVLRLQKAWVNPVAGDEAVLSISGPDASTSDRVTAVAPAGGGTSDQVAEAPIFSGETVDLNEELPAGNTGAYTSEIACVPDTGFTAGEGGQSGSIDVPMHPEDTTCTITNTRSATGELTLQKDWVNGASGDSAGLSASGSLGSGSATATVPDHGATSIDKVVIAVTAGETVDLSEVLPASGHTNTGTYTSTLECNEPGLHGVAGDGRSGSFDVTAAHENVTCTFTNTRVLAQPSITTELSASSITAGDSVHDTATLHGATSDATGDVQYRFYDSLDACTADTDAFMGDFSVLGGTLVNTVNVADGVVPDSAEHTFDTAGSFFWAAFYTGDGNNAAAAGGCATEELTVTPTAPSISVEKQADVASFTEAGQVITYTFRVTNTGDVPLHDVTVTDSKLGTVPCPATTLAPGVSMTCTARYTTTAADVNHGSIANVGLATGTTPGGKQVRARSTVVLPFTGAPQKPAPPPHAPKAPVQKVPVQVTG